MAVGTVRDVEEETEVPRYRMGVGPRLNAGF